MIRPCSVYRDEYDDCTSIKARFHQYFIFGESVDCSQWKKDYDNCKRYQESNGNDVAASEAIIQSETDRRRKRLEAHFGNTTWSRRKLPPEDWSKPLPDWIRKKNENTYLEIKQKELDGLTPAEKPDKFFCAIM
ncbi:synaptic plasticity regulator PANTS isoform X2 [Eurosta solidaginis]|uniref:synaptic plasticity regulator PANTS isoform X2 n=1 Tax=Eurosta solidaginis TaxID=178769 RepID=UPI0035305EE3